MTKIVDGELTAKETAWAEKMAKAIVDDRFTHLATGKSTFVSPGWRTVTGKRLSDLPLPNGKKLSDCTPRDLLVVSHAYAIAAARFESNNSATLLRRKAAKRTNSTKE